MLTPELLAKIETTMATVKGLRDTPPEVLRDLAATLAPRLGAPPEAYAACEHIRALLALGISTWEPVPGLDDLDEDEPIAPALVELEALRLLPRERVAATADRISAIADAYAQAGDDDAPAFKRLALLAEAIASEAPSELDGIPATTRLGED